MLVCVSGRWHCLLVYGIGVCAFVRAGRWVGARVCRLDRQRVHCLCVCLLSVQKVRLTLSV